MKNHTSSLVNTAKLVLLVTLYIWNAMLNIRFCCSYGFLGTTGAFYGLMAMLDLWPDDACPYTFKLFPVVDASACWARPPLGLLFGFIGGCYWTPMLGLTL